MRVAPGPEPSRHQSLAQMWGTTGHEVPHLFLAWFGARACSPEPRLAFRKGGGLEMGPAAARPLGVAPFRDELMLPWNRAGLLG